MPPGACGAAAWLFLRGFWENGLSNPHRPSSSKSQRRSRKADLTETSDSTGQCRRLGNTVARMSSQLSCGPSRTRPELPKPQQSLRKHRDLLRTTRARMELWSWAAASHTHRSWPALLASFACPPQVAVSGRDRPWQPTASAGRGQWLSVEAREANEVDGHIQRPNGPGRSNSAHVPTPGRLLSGRTVRPRSQTCQTIVSISRCREH